MENIVCFMCKSSSCRNIATSLQYEFLMLANVLIISLLTILKFSWCIKKSAWCLTEVILVRLGMDADICIGIICMVSICIKTSFYHMVGEQHVSLYYTLCNRHQLYMCE